MPSALTSPRLNDPAERGPVTLLGKLEPTPPYDPMTDGLQWLVNDTVRLQRGPLPGTSARAIHVGNPNGVNYSFDPRLLAIVKIWQGGFLDMSGELTNRGGKGLALGYESREIGFGEREYLLAPLNAAGQLLDFDASRTRKFGDIGRHPASRCTARRTSWRASPRSTRSSWVIRATRADKLAAPVFRYRVAKNTIEVATTISAAGEIEDLASAANWRRRSPSR